MQSLFTLNFMQFFYIFIYVYKNSLSFMVKQFNRFLSKLKIYFNNIYYQFICIKTFLFSKFFIQIDKKNLMIFHVMFKSRAIFYEITFTKQFARFTNYTIIIYFSLVQFITSSNEVMILEAVYLYICFEIEIKFSFNVKLYLYYNFKNYIYF